MGERIRLLRKVLNLTQQEFADRIGVKRNTIAQYEIGRNEPIDSILSLICREFDVNEEWLRTGSGEMFKEVDTEARFAEWAGRVLSGTDESFQKRFVTMMMSLTDDQWKLLEEKARMLFEENKKG
jgi:transcriptional regulator with XRE-family HTH domain